MVGFLMSVSLALVSDQRLTSNMCAKPRQYRVRLTNCCDPVPDRHWARRTVAVIAFTLATPWISAILSECASYREKGNRAKLWMRMNVLRAKPYWRRLPHFHRPKKMPPTMTPINLRHRRRQQEKVLAPTVPAGVRVYAVGDVHGQLGLLTKLMVMIRNDAATTDRCVLIFVGDYVDRGLQSRQVIDFLLDNPAPGFETVFLKGNHEAWLLAFLEDAIVGREWLAAGGQATLFSYDVAMPSGPRDTEFLETLRRALAAALPNAHKAFLQSCPLHHVEGGYTFVHAGIRPGLPLAEQCEEDLLWARFESFDGDQDYGTVVVHGHSVSAEPAVGGNRIGIDTGAYATGRLTCLVLEGASQRFLQT